MLTVNSGRFECDTPNIDPNSWKDARAYKIHILTTKDEDGQFSTVALNLPGAGSCGESEEEAIANAIDAIKGAIEIYEEANKEIPWTDSSNEDIPFGAKQKWIIVHV